MSTGDPSQPKTADNTYDDEELVLEEEVEDPEAENNSSGEGIELIEVDEVVVDTTKKTEEEDDDIELIEVEKRLFTEEFYETERKLKKLAEEFCDPESRTNICNLPIERRQAIARYAALLFEWFCCMPTADKLAELGNMTDLGLPFPITPDIRRILLRRDLGVRLTDLWRQSKSVAKMAGHFKLNENIALLTLLDHGLTNSSYDLDVAPMLREQQMMRMDYYNTGSFLVANSDPALWKTPEELVCELLLPPISASVCLYILHTECIRGTPVKVPWESLQIEQKDIPVELLAEFEETVLAAFEQLGDSDEKKMADRLESEKWKLQRAMDATCRETAVAREHLRLGEKAMGELRTQYDQLCKLRVDAIANIKPENFDATGEALKKAEEDILVVEHERQEVVKFEKHLIDESDVVFKEGDKVLARRNEDSREVFQEAVIVSVEGADDTLQVRFTRDPAAGGEAPVVALPKTNVAVKAVNSFPLSAEGLRVVARARHPCHPKKEGYYSGTIISKYDMQHDEYLVVFDDMFDRYAKRKHMHLIVAQAFINGKYDRRMVHKLVTHNPSLKDSSSERQSFIHYFSLRYPAWTMVKMKEKMGKNVFVKHRSGEQWAAQALATDRAIVTLRFNPMNEDVDKHCLDFPCTRHEHLDEEMYRGNPRLIQVRTTCNFDNYHKSFQEYVQSGISTPFQLRWASADGIMSRALQRRLRRHGASGVAFEPAVPAGEAAAEMQQQQQQQVKVYVPGQKVKFRKQGTALQVEMAVPLLRHQKSRNSQSTPILDHHLVQKCNFRDMPRHPHCGPECLKGKDADGLDPQFAAGYHSPFYIPVLCGWTRLENTIQLSRKNKDGVSEVTSFYYRAPCGRPFYRANELIDFLELTRSELTIDLFTFSGGVDVTSYVVQDDKFCILGDLTRGSEGRPLPVVNDMDNENVPTFLYRSRRYGQTEMVDLRTLSKEFCSGCDCTDDCRDWTKCACQRLTHRESVRGRGYLGPVTKGYINGFLPRKVVSGVYECNENCGCSRKRCFNRVVQNDVKVPMQMMKTEDMGWGIRTLCDIPQGTFISCYQGAIMSDDMAENFGEGDEYYADIDFYNVAETEKENSGVDVMKDLGIVDDCGLRDLTLKEIAEAEGDDDVTQLRKEVRNENREKRREAKEARKIRKEEEEEGQRRRQAAGGEQVGDGYGEGEEAERVKEEGGEEEEEAIKMEEGEEEEEEGEGQEDDEGVETEDEDVDEGLGRGESADDEEDEMEEAKQREEEEEERKKQVEEAKREEEKKRRMEERKKAQQEAGKRYTIPFRGENKMLQYEIYFEEKGTTSLYTLDAKACGNLGRQFNHSCDPNMFTQHVFVDTHDIRLPWVAFFTSRDVKAGEELCWDYGYSGSVVDEFGQPVGRGLKCKCGAESCRVDLL